MAVAPEHSRVSSHGTAVSSRFDPARWPNSNPALPRVGSLCDSFFPPPNKTFARGAADIGSRPRAPIPPSLRMNADGVPLVADPRHLQAHAYGFEI
jgi:hypothetical protein